MQHESLAFLDQVLGPRSCLYRESKWLISDFNEDVWRFKMKSPNTGEFCIDFNLKLLNGSFLTDKINRRLLNTFKYWINASVHPDNTRGRGFSYADVTARNIIIKVINLIDYFLLNDKYLNISSCGLQAITEDHLKQFSDEQANSKRIAEHVYGWTDRLSKFLISQVDGFNYDDERMNSYKCDGIDFFAISENQLEQDTLSIPNKLIPSVRFWLWENSLYRKTSKGQYKYVVNTTRLSKLIYGSITLRGGSISQNMSCHT